MRLQPKYEGSQKIWQHQGSGGNTETRLVTDANRPVAVSILQRSELQRKEGKIEVQL